jgi:hypothetical protein
MKLSFESKYEPGDTVYHLVGWITDIRIVERQIEAVTGVSENGIRYKLKPFGKTSLFGYPILERSLYATREEAFEVGKLKFEKSKRKNIESLEEDIRKAKLEARERIAGFAQDVEEELQETVKYLKEKINNVEKRHL